MNCEYCHKQLVNENAYEDGLYRMIGTFLCNKTCIPWFRFHPEFVAPKDTMYGMIHIGHYVSSQSSATLRDVEEADGTLSHCLALEEQETFMLDLHVFRELGEPVRLDQDQTPATVHKSAADILKMVNTYFTKQEFYEELRDQDLTVQRGKEIITTINHRNNRWEHWAEARHTVQSCRRTSYPIDGGELAYCVVTCDGKPLCLEDPVCP